MPTFFFCLRKIGKISTDTMQRNLLSFNEDRRYSRCPCCTTRNFFARTWATVLKRSSEWDRWTKRRVKVILTAIVLFSLVGISLALLGILGLFYKKNPEGTFSSQTFCEIPDFRDEAEFHYDGYRFVSPTNCYPGAQLSQDHYCLVECNHTGTMRYTVRTEYESVSLRPEHEWDLEGYVEYRRAKWSCDSREPALTCLRPCNVPSADLIPNSNSLASCTNKVHGDSCDISCESTYTSVESKIWCNDGDWVVCEDYTTYPDLTKCAYLNDISANTGSVRNVSESIVPVCQQECVLSASDLSSAGYHFKASTTCSNVHACESDPTQVCLSTNQDCYLHCLDQHECVNPQTMEMCEMGSAIRARCQNAQIVVEYGNNGSSSSSFLNPQNLDVFLTNPQLSCLETYIQDTKVNVTALASVENVTVNVSNFARSTEYTLSLSCFDDENNETVFVAENEAYLASSSEFSSFEIQNIDLGPCSDSKPFLRITSVQRSCDMSCAECMGACTTNENDGLETLWQNVNETTVAMVLQLRDTSTSAVFHLETFSSSTITIQGYGFQPSENYNIEFASVLDFSNETCESISLNSLAPCEDAELCNTSSMICSICAPYTIDCARYEATTMYVNMSYKSLQTLYRPVATAQIIVSSIEDTVVCSNVTQVTVRGSGFFSNANQYIATFQSSHDTTQTTSHSAIEKNNASELVFEIQCDELPFNDCTEAKQIVLSEFTGDGVTQTFSNAISIANVMCILDTSQTMGVLRESQGGLVTVQGYNFHPLNFVSVDLVDVGGSVEELKYATNVQVLSSNVTEDGLVNLILQYDDESNIHFFDGHALGVRITRTNNALTHEEVIGAEVGAITQTVDTSIEYSIEPSLTSQVTVTGRGFKSDMTYNANISFTGLNDCHCSCPCVDEGLENVEFNFVNFNAIVASNLDMESCMGCQVNLNSVLVNGDVSISSWNPVGQILQLSSDLQNLMFPQGSSSENTVTLRGAGFAASDSYSLVWMSGEFANGSDASIYCGSNEIGLNSTFDRQSSETILVDGLETSECVGFLFVQLTYTSSSFDYSFDLVRVAQFFYILEADEGLIRGSRSTLSFTAGGIDISPGFSTRYSVQFQVENTLENCEPNNDIALSASPVSGSELVRFDAQTEFGTNCSGRVYVMLTQVTVDKSTPFVPIGTVLFLSFSLSLSHTQQHTHKSLKYENIIRISLTRIT